MPARRPRRGAVSAIVLIIIAVVVIGLGVFYFASDPFSSKVDEKVRQATKWTPENIQKDPAGYFTWAIAELKKGREKLKANTLSITIEKEKAVRAAATNSAHAAALKKTLDSAKAAYKALPDAGKDAGGNTVKKFPLNWGGGTFATLPEFQRQVLQAENKRQNAEKLATQFQASARKLDTYIAQLAEKENETAMKLDTATAQLKMVKAGQVISGLGEIGKSINDLLVTTDVVAAQAGASGGPSIADIAAEAAANEKTGQTAADFEALMK
jgi:DNA repair exonuclease SbcCD ATPase subunit